MIQIIILPQADLCILQSILNLQHLFHPILPSSTTKRGKTTTFYQIHPQIRKVRNWLLVYQKLHLVPSKIPSRVNQHGWLSCAQISLAGMRVEVFHLCHSSYFHSVSQICSDKGKVFMQFHGFIFINLLSTMKFSIERKGLSNKYLFHDCSCRQERVHASKLLPM